MSWATMPGPGVVGYSGGGSVSYWNPSRISSNFTISNANKTVAGTGGSWNCGEGVQSRSSGKWYFEISCDNVGSGFLAGLGDASLTLTGAYLGVDSHGWAFQNTGNYLHIGLVSNLGVTYTTGNIVGIAVDLDTGNLWFSVNGTWAQGDPGTGASPVTTNATGTLFPAVSLYSNGGQATLRVKNSEFSHAAPSGFSSWSGV